MVTASACFPTQAPAPRKKPSWRLHPLHQVPRHCFSPLQAPVLPPGTMAQQAVVAPVPTPELPILGGLRWYQIPLSSLRAPSTGLFSRRFQDSLQRYRQLRLTKRLRVGRPYALLGDPDPASPPAQVSPLPLGQVGTVLG